MRLTISLADILVSLISVIYYSIINLPSSSEA